MGKLTPQSDDLAEVVEFTLSAPGIGTLAARQVWQKAGVFNFTLTGFTGTARLVRSFDGGQSWVPLARDVTGAAAEFTGPVSMPVHELEAGVLYTVQLVTRTTGACTVRFSK